MEDLETIYNVCDALKNTQNIRKLRKTGFSVENPYDTIRLFTVCDHLKLLSARKVKGEGPTKSAKYYICPLKNWSVG